MIVARIFVTDESNWPQATIVASAWSWSTKVVSNQPHAPTDSGQRQCEGDHVALPFVAHFTPARMVTMLFAAASRPVAWRWPCGEDKSRHLRLGRRARSAQRGAVVDLFTIDEATADARGGRNPETNHSVSQMIGSGGRLRGDSWHDPRCRSLFNCGEGFDSRNMRGRHWRPQLETAARTDRSRTLVFVSITPLEMA